MKSDKLKIKYCGKIFEIKKKDAIIFKDLYFNNKEKLFSSSEKKSILNSYLINKGNYKQMIKELD